MHTPYFLLFYFGLFLLVLLCRILQIQILINFRRYFFLIYIQIKSYKDSMSLLDLISDSNSLFSLYFFLFLFLYFLLYLLFSKHFLVISFLFSAALFRIFPLYFYFGHYQISLYNFDEFL